MFELSISIVISYNQESSPNRKIKLTTVGKLQREYTALVKVKLVFVRLCDVKNLNITALHPNSEPFSCGTVAEGEDLRRKYEYYYRHHVAFSSS